MNERIYLGTGKTITCQYAPFTWKRCSLLVEHTYLILSDLNIKRNDLDANIKEQILFRIKKF